MLCIDQVVAKEIQTEIIKLQERINKVEKDMIKSRKIYELNVKDRNKVGLMLIDRNDELCIFYEKNNVQVCIINQTISHLMEKHVWRLG